MTMTDGPVALVTGAGAGIGLATGRRLLAAGHRIVANDVDPAALAAAWGDESADRVVHAVADVSDADAVTAAVDAAVGRLGRLDAVVNNAALHGAAWVGPCLDSTPEQWRRLLDVNVVGIVNVVRACADHLAASGGVVVNVSSMVAYGIGAGSGYAVTKAAVNGLTTSLASELGPRGIRVVGVAPGFISTPYLLSGMSEERQRALVGQQVMDVHGGPEDIAAVIEFLVSPSARLVTGHTLIADAGALRRP
jgi:NAD(P)-dependent dehydrogenase (short-subunit alcohol dehydrogenase family)